MAACKSREQVAAETITKGFVHMCLLMTSMQAGYSMGQLYMEAQHCLLSHCFRQVLLFELASFEKVGGKVVGGKVVLSTIVVASHCCGHDLLPIVHLLRGCWVG